MSPEAALVVEMGAQAGLPLACQGEVHADVQGWIGRRCIRDLPKPWPGHHHGAARHKPARGKVQEGAVRAVACTKVVDMGHHGAAQRPAQRSLNQGHSQKSRAELSRAIAPPRVISASPRHRESEHSIPCKPEPL